MGTVSQRENPSSDQADRKLLNLFIGSNAFKWCIGVIGAGVVAVFVVGWNTMASNAASSNPDVRSAKVDIEGLQTAVKVLSSTANQHTLQLAAAEEERKRSAEIQEKIFSAIKQLSSDVNAIDVHVGKLDQKVEDLKDSPHR